MTLLNYIKKFMIIMIFGRKGYHLHFENMYVNYMIFPTMHMTLIMNVL